MDRRANRCVDAAALSLHQLSLLLLLAAALRFAVLTHDVRFHPDEALYATYARRMSRYGDLLLSDAPLDKPPLGMFVNALSFSALGESEFTARLPAVFFSLTNVAVCYALARRLISQRVALIVAAIIALSPFDLAFSGSAFHDPLLTLCCTLCALMLGRAQALWAGVFAACAIATKQSALHFLPIYLLIGAAGLQRLTWRTIVTFSAPILAVSLALAAWSAARAAPVDFWTLGILNPGALRLIRSDEVLPRLARWLSLYGESVGFVPLLLISAYGTWQAFQAPTRASVVALIAACGLLATLLAYWLVAFPIYDRYLLPLVPLTALLIGYGMATWRSRMATFAVLILIVPFTLRTVRNEHSIGIQSELYRGVDQLAAYINRLDGAPIVYDHWLSWELRYYLGDSPRAQLVWYPSAEWLSRDVCNLPTPSYFAAPESAAWRWLAILNAAGARLEPIARTPLVLYRITCELSAP
ncbi:MAG: glycosyltransferase family 39 protein [Anaerolineae bacterium]|nr:glycosyltransferase family 39 protein [Anaerolineae bacterium]MDW8298981.1 glycosyltransferase family 39 protein [Anaerolineae bacterium]